MANNTYIPRDPILGVKASGAEADTSAASDGTVLQFAVGTPITFTNGKAGRYLQAVATMTADSTVSFAAAFTTSIGTGDWGPLAAKGNVPTGAYTWFYSSV